MMHKSSIPQKYFFLEHSADGRLIRHEIGTDYLDVVGEVNNDSISKEQQRSDSLFFSTLPMVLRYEGGLVNNPKDRRGKTNMGITKGFLNTYKKKSGVKVDDVEKITQGDAVKLYEAEWDIYGFGKLDNTDIIKKLFKFLIKVFLYWKLSFRCFLYSKMPVTTFFAVT